jgi:hypothetical protein
MALGWKFSNRSVCKCPPYEPAVAACGKPSVQRLTHAPTAFNSSQEAWPVRVAPLVRTCERDKPPPASRLWPARGRFLPLAPPGASSDHGLVQALSLATFSYCLPSFKSLNFSGTLNFSSRERGKKRLHLGFVLRWPRRSHLSSYRHLCVNLWSCNAKALFDATIFTSGPGRRKIAAAVASVTMYPRFGT